MNVAELIEELQKHLSDMMVILDGYEGGYTTLVQKNIGELDIILNDNKGMNYVGEHGRAYGDDTNKVTALLLAR